MIVLSKYGKAGVRERAARVLVPDRAFLPPAIQTGSSDGRAPVSKTGSRRFEPCPVCKVSDNLNVAPRKLGS